MRNDDTYLRDPREDDCDNCGLHWSCCQCEDPDDDGDECGARDGSSGVTFDSFAH